MGTHVRLQASIATMCASRYSAHVVEVCGAHAQRMACAPVTGPKFPFWTTLPRVLPVDRGPSGQREIDVNTIGHVVIDAHAAGSASGRVKLWCRSRLARTGSGSTHTSKSKSSRPDGCAAILLVPLVYSGTAGGLNERPRCHCTITLPDSVKPTTRFCGPALVGARACVCTEYCVRARASGVHACNCIAWA